MIRFYGMGAKECLALPVSMFMALYRAIGHLKLEEEAYLLSITHNGEPGKRVKEIIDTINPRSRDSGMPVGAMLLLNTPGVQAEAVSGSILALRERQKESAIRLKAEFDREKAEALARGETFSVFPPGLPSINR